MFIKKAMIILIGMIVVMAAGIIGYMAIEEWSFFDSLYMTVITLATVGYGETHELSRDGRIFTIVLIFCGTGFLVYAASALTAFFVEGELKNLLRRRVMEKAIGKLSSHYIVCGGGRTGRSVIEELAKTRREFVVVDADAEKAREYQDRGFLCVQGDASHDEILQKAGIAVASGLVAAVHTDQDNLFIVLTARGLNPSLRIVSKVLEQESIAKFRRAGADAVVSPEAIGGLRLASELTRPAATTFLDSMLRSKEKTLRIEEVSISAGSPLEGTTLESSDIARRTGLLTLAIKQASAKDFLFNPPSATRLTKGDAVVVMGEIEGVETLRKMATGENKT